jgi:exopolyphosphatase/guanosine-5'-triphosphate,3'-diphosphate pyrophosphatase
LSVYAAIDIGTNSVLLLVAKKTGPDSWIPLENRARITRLGEGLAQSGSLAEDAMERTCRTVCEFILGARTQGAASVVVIGTHALRYAINRQVFLDKVRRRCDTPVEVITGPEEARLAGLGAVTGLGMKGDEPVVLDVGGGSTELIRFSGQRGLEQISLAVGCVTLTETCLSGDTVSDEEIARAREIVREKLRPHVDRYRTARLAGIGGTVTSMAAISLELEKYDPVRVHGFLLTIEEITRQIQLFQGMSRSERRSIPGLEPARADIILAGALVLKETMRDLNIKSIIVSDWGIRHGLLIDRFRSSP